MRDRVCGLKLREDRRGRCLRREGPSVVALLSCMFWADQFILLLGVWNSKVRARYFLNDSWYLTAGELRTGLIVEGDYVCVRARQRPDRQVIEQLLSNEPNDLMSPKNGCKAKNSQHGHSDENLPF